MCIVEGAGTTQRCSWLRRFRQPRLKRLDRATLPRRIDSRVRAVCRPPTVPLRVLQTRRLSRQLVVFQAAAVRNQNPSPVLCMDLFAVRHRAIGVRCISS
jgi:hypothetical protein